MNSCQFALFMLKFVIVVWSSEFLICTLSVITQWSLIEGMSVTFKDRIGCKDGDPIVRSDVDFEVADVLVCCSLFKTFSWFLLMEFKT